MIDPKVASGLREIKRCIHEGRPYVRIERALVTQIEELQRDALRYRTLRDALHSSRWYRITQLGIYVELQRSDVGPDFPNGKNGWYRSLDEALDAMHLEERNEGKRVAKQSDSG